LGAADPVPFVARSCAERYTLVRHVVCILHQATGLTLSEVFLQSNGGRYFL
jgi:hypothetical protein